ncbi:MAG: anthranilate synthase family protein [Verrucomicrobiota bacterium]
MDLSSPFFLYSKGAEACFYAGTLKKFQCLKEVPRPSHGSKNISISMVPYSQIKERDCEAHGEDEKIFSLLVEREEKIDLKAFLQGIEDQKITIEGELEFRPTDEEFMAGCQAIIEDEIKRGEGSNFLYSRKTLGRISQFNSETALIILKRLLAKEFDAYWNFCFFTGEQYFIGSSPERHLTFVGDTVLMNPICGTLPKSQLKSEKNLHDFITDPKEVNELFQVVDEELKMMSKICYAGGLVKGPFLKEMGSVLHTEYLLEGKSGLDKIEAFRASMFAATMVGSPLENAARVIYKYEKESRRYYSSAVMLLANDEKGKEFLDSAITIRTIEIDQQGYFSVQSGASIVRDSDPKKECEEIKAKAQGLLKAISQPEERAPMRVLQNYLSENNKEIFNNRNDYLSKFWIEKQRDLSDQAQEGGQEILIIDNEDEFTYMLRHMLNHLGFVTKVTRVENYDKAQLGAKTFTVLGPGPGDPLDLECHRMKSLHEIAQDLLKHNRKFLAVCLSHQVLCKTLGFDIIRVDPPLQGVQKEINFFGKREKVGFYNTYFANYHNHVETAVEIEASKTEEGYVTALRSENFHSFQFHVESILTTNGIRLLQNAMKSLGV